MFYILSHLQLFTNPDNGLLYLLALIAIIYSTIYLSAKKQDNKKYHFWKHAG